jgi:hypothetical protein
MSKSAPTPLTWPAISKKGEAAPAVASLAQPAPATRSPFPEPPPGRLSSRVQATIAVTVRLDETRYERMKTWGTIRRVTNQEIIVAALDRFFGLTDEEREDGIARVRR